LIKSNEDSKKLCRRDEKNACSLSSKKNSLSIYKCHAGLIEAVAPITMNGLTIGYIMFGQVVEKKEDIPAIIDYAQQYVEDKTELNHTVEKFHIKEYSQIKAAASIMQACTSYLWISELIKIDGENNVYLLTDYINRNIADDLSVDKLCSVLKVSRVGLYAISEKYLGMSIAKYIRKKRVACAKEFLQQGNSVANAAKMVGIFDSNYFSKYFKKETGMTPSEYKSAQNELDL